MTRHSRSLVAALIALSLTACTPSPSGPPVDDGASQSPAPAPSASAAGPGTTAGTPAPPPTPAVPTGDDAPTPTVPAAPAVEAVEAHDDPARIDVVVNKRRPLSPGDYAPEELRAPEVPTATANALLRPDTATAAEEMFRTAEDDGVGLTLVSAYRSYAEQEATYAYWVAVHGDAAVADTVSARPGHSEHQTGLALDIGAADGACTLEACFADTPAAQWAAEHAADFGFVLRYPVGATGITGYSPESWHFRFVGTEVARAMRSAGTLTLEEHFGLPAAPSY